MGHHTVRAENLDSVRLDVWLWAARFFKTRTRAQEAIAAGHVKRGGERVKASHRVKVGERYTIRIGPYEWQITVAALSDRRGPAEVAQTLYHEDPASHARRQAQVAERRALQAAPTKPSKTAIDRARLRALKRQQRAP
jgi:ribosome-associated heat shock protein Hsp15